METIEYTPNSKVSEEKELTFAERLAKLAEKDEGRVTMNLRPSVYDWKFEPLEKGVI